MTIISQTEMQSTWLGSKIKSKSEGEQHEKKATQLCRGCRYLKDWFYSSLEWNPKVLKFCERLFRAKVSGSLPNSLGSTDHKKTSFFIFIFMEKKIKNPSWLQSGSQLLKSMKCFQHLTHLQNWNHKLDSLNTDSNSNVLLVWFLHYKHTSWLMHVRGIYVKQNINNTWFYFVIINLHSQELRQTVAKNKNRRSTNQIHI